MKRLVGLGVFVFVAFAIPIGCERVYDSVFSLNKKIPGLPSPTYGGIVFKTSSTDNSYLEASIVSVKTECFPVEHPPIEMPALRKGKYTDYEISVTAGVFYIIKDKNYFRASKPYSGKHSANVIFEAITSNGVVLGESTGIAEFIENSNSTDVSAKIMGLSEEAVRRISLVQARWEYGS